MYVVLVQITVIIQWPMEYTYIPWLATFWYYPATHCFYYGLHQDATHMQLETKKKKVK